MLIYITSEAELLEQKMEPIPFNFLKFEKNAQIECVCQWMRQKLLL
jgi:hypothetical protein